ncbi:hypothetical protein SAMN06265350_11221 [Solitalea koreensis]|uniref:Uncharacterized protein n=1 Tax=Solitalea koreensis TaxID=543615 RepID=A0A521E7D3_9SPHI|nr:hypothetical protein SAMN06265350_11221 [Solitalea koreensis]
MLTQTFSKWVIYAEYQANKSFIEKYLCENKNRPELACHGQCYLMKKLKKDAQEEQGKTGTSRDKFETQVFTQTAYSSPFASAYFELNVQPKYLIIGSISSCYTDIFHPPQVA